jgi:hypothetical protein
MGRGLGKVQRFIMKQLERDGYVIQRDVDEFSQPSVSRAVGSLAERGLVNVWYCNLRTVCMYPHWNGERQKKNSHRWCAVVVSPDIDTGEKFDTLRDRHGLWLHR